MIVEFDARRPEPAGQTLSGTTSAVVDSYGRIPDIPCSKWQVAVACTRTFTEETYDDQDRRLW